MREHKALRAALSTILSVSMVLGSVPTAAIAEVLDEDTPLVVEVVEEGAPEEAVLAEGEVVPEEAALAEGEVVPEEEAIPTEEVVPSEEAHVEEAAPEEEAAPTDEPAALELTAASDEEAVIPMGEFPTTTTVVDEGEEGDLLGHYIEQLFEQALPGNDEPTMTAQMVALTGKEAAAFEALGPMIARVAHGSHPSTVLEVPLGRITNKTRYTASELGVDWVYNNGQYNQEAIKAAAAMVRPDTSLLLKYLLYSHPYEMYWFDKTVGMKCGGPSFLAVGSGGEYALDMSGSISFTFAVAPAYSAGEYTVDTSQASRAQAAVETAQQIAARGASDSPYYRLKLFNDTICQMVSYNDAAAGGGVDYGDPWQLVYVFDNDDTTNVVCEGYSKAFKYLCDLANITGVTCSTMSGTMDGGTGAGAHMWDVVNMDDGKNYLVDVTNCDQGTVGYPHQLFIVPFSSGSVSDGYVFQTGSKPITYVYDADMSQLYTNSEMTISATEYDPSQYDPDAAAAQVVIDQIAALPTVENLTLENANAVSAARAAYDALTEAQKALVANYDTLTAAEAKIAQLQQAADDQAAANGVIEMISHLPAVNRLTLGDQGRVAAARSAYENLTEAQQALVTNYETLTAAEAKIAQLQAAADQNAAQPIINAIAALPEVDQLTLANADAVTAARTAYDELTEAQQALVTNDETLTAAEAKIAQLQQQAAADQTAAQQVIDAIAALTAVNELTLDDAADVSAARTAYNALTEAQQALVTNYETLTAAEAKIADLTAANAVDEQIAALPAVDQLTLDNVGAVSAARTAYDALSEAQKAIVTNYTTLTAAEAKIAELQAAADQQAADQAAADSVIAKIAAIPVLADLALDDADLVTTARTAYDALTAAQKALVTNYETLTDAETKIADLTAAHAVDEQIADLPAVDVLTLDDADDVAAARAAFDTLTDAQKMLVENLDALEDAEERIEELQAAAAQHEIDLAAAKAVDDEIADLPAVDTLTLDDADAVAAARTAYNALTDTQKDLVENLATLTAAEARITDLTAAQAVETKIAALPQVDELTLDDQTQVMTARAAYDDLTEAQQQLVQNYNVLKDAEAQIAELWKQEADKEAASIVDGQIDMLPAVEALTLGDADAVATVRAAYDELTAEQKAYVTKLDKLVAAETRIADLTAAKAVDTKIAELPQVDALTLDDADLVADARSAYEGLTETQKGLVSNYDTLTAAEAKIAQLQQAAADAAAAKAVDEAIAALPVIDELTLDNQAQVAAARAAYDALTADQKALVQNLDTLIAAEAKITQLQQAAADAATAKAVDDAIAALPAVDALTLNDQAQVAAARAAYDALTDTQKALVEKLDTLTAAEARIQELQAAADQHAIDVAAARGVDAKIEALPAVDELTLDNAAAVAEARSAYNALTDAQKGLVEKLSVLEAAEAKIAALQQAADDLAAAQAVDAKINALPAVDELTLDNAAAVAEARSAYNALTDAQKPLVEKLNVLEAAEAKIAELQQAAADAAEAQAVIDAIAALPTVAELTLDDAADVSAARTAYDALTEAQRTLVTNYETLTAAEARIADLNAANAVDELIADLPAVDELTLDDADDVAAARTAYDALTDAQKGLVEKLGVLEAAEAKIADLTAAKAVDDSIAALPAVDELTLANADAVAAARSAYNALTDAQKPLVTKLSVLEAAEAKIADLTAANAVDEQIADLPTVDELTLDDVDDVAAARTAYNALTDAQKSLVQKLDVLTAAEAKIAELQQQAEDRAAAQPVIDAIAALPAIDELTLNDANDVAAARTTYNTLTDAQKAYVTNYETLTAAEAKITDLTAANAVDEQIADLPAVDQLTLGDAEDVANARAAYDALSDAQQALVTNYSVLKAAEQKIADLQQAAADQAAAQQVIDAIAALQPTDELTLEDADDVAAARSAYDALTDAQKALVTNYETLAAAEAKIASIHIPLTDAVVKVTSKVYNGKAQTPQVTVTLNGAQLTEGTDFTVSDGTYINVGTYEVTVTGTGKYEGTATGTFTITPKAVTVTANDLSKTYGETDPELTAAVKGTLNSYKVNYTLARAEGENVGEYAITLTGAKEQGNYTVTFVSGTFTIAAKDIAETTVASIPAKTYTGSALKPAPTVKDNGTKLVKGTDYTVSYKNNTKAGTATVTITGKGNYTGTKTATFKINPKSIAASSVTVSSIAKQKWTGKAIKPTPVVKDGTKTLKSGTDYKLTYKNNKEPGTATITIKGTGNYTGSRTTTFRIGAKPGTWKKSGSKWWYQYADKTYPKNQFADIDGARYYFDGSGYMVTGWKKVGNYWYYFRSDGKMGANDWAKSGSKWCYLDSVGRMVTGWRTISNVRYYFDANGYMVTGWKTISGKDYYFKSSGAMAKSEWIGNYYVGADGAWVKGKTK